MIRSYPLIGYDDFMRPTRTQLSLLQDFIEEEITDYEDCLESRMSEGAISISDKAGNKSS